MAEGQREAVGAVDLSQLVHLLLVHQDVVRPEEPVAHPGPALRGAVVVGGGHLVEVALDLRPDLLLGTALVLGRLLGDGALEALVVEQLGDLLRRGGREPLTHCSGQRGPGELSDRRTAATSDRSFPPRCAQAPACGANYRRTPSLATASAQLLDPCFRLALTLR